MSLFSRPAPAPAGHAALIADCNACDRTGQVCRPEVQDGQELILCVDVDGCIAAAKTAGIWTEA